MIEVQVEPGNEPVRRFKQIPSGSELVRIGSETEQTMRARNQLSSVVKSLERIVRFNPEAIGAAMAPAQAKQAEEAFRRAAVWWRRCEATTQ
jgi:hypothetical protein